MSNFNTGAGWVLAGCVAALGLSIVGSTVFQHGRPAKMGYPIEGAEDTEAGGGAAAEVPIATLLPTADPVKGADVFKKCAACHTINQGGAAGVGPNLYGVIGKPHGHMAGFPYSDALKSVAGNWDFDALNAWLTSPRKYAPGTKMTFAGLSNPQDRANVIAYLNSQGSNVPIPAAPAAAAKADGAAQANVTDGTPTGDLENRATPETSAPSLDKEAAKQAEAKAGLPKSNK